MGEGVKVKDKWSNGTMCVFLWNVWRRAVLCVCVCPPNPQTKYWQDSTELNYFQSAAKCQIFIYILHNLQGWGI